MTISKVVKIHQQILRLFLSENQLLELQVKTQKIWVISAHLNLQCTFILRRIIIHGKTQCMDKFDTNFDMIQLCFLGILVPF